jgi:hypothetical protein
MVLRSIIYGKIYGKIVGRIKIKCNFAIQENDKNINIK